MVDENPLKTLMVSKEALRLLSQGLTPEMLLKAVSLIAKGNQKGLQIAAHPDRGGSEDLAARINEALEAIKDPFTLRSYIKAYLQSSNENHAKLISSNKDLQDEIGLLKRQINRSKRVLAAREAALHGSQNASSMYYEALSGSEMYISVSDLSGKLIVLRDCFLENRTVTRKVQGVKLLTPSGEGKYELSEPNRGVFILGRRIRTGSSTNELIPHGDLLSVFSPIVKIGEDVWCGSSTKDNKKVSAYSRGILMEVINNGDSE